MNLSDEEALAIFESGKGFETEELEYSELVSLVIKLMRQLDERDEKMLSKAWNRGLVSGIGYATRVQNDIDTWEPVNPYRATPNESPHP